MKPATFTALAEAYIEENHYLARNSIKSLRNSIKSLTSFARGQRLSVALVEAWTDFLIRDGYAISSLHVMRTQVKTLCAWAMASGDATEQFVQPIRNLPAAPPPKVDRIITFPEYQTLLAHPNREGEEYFPEIIRLGWETGLRLSDCACLKKKHVDLPNAALHLLPRKTQKHGKGLDLPLSPEMLAIIAARMSGEPVADDCVSSASYVWPGAAYSYEIEKQLSWKFTIMARRCGVKCPHFHALRHARVTTMLEAGESTAMVRSITGHSLEALQIYMTHISLEAKRAAIQRVSAHLERKSA